MTPPSLIDAAKAMLENYLELKRITLAMAKSDAPGWIGQSMTPEDDIHVQAVRAAIAAHESAPPPDNREAVSVIQFLCAQIEHLATKAFSDEATTAMFIKKCDALNAAKQFLKEHKSPPSLERELAESLRERQK